MKPDEQLRKLEAATAAAKEATREAHEVLSDLRDVSRGIQKLLATVDAEAEKSVQERIKPIVEQGLASYAAALNVAIDQATDAVYNRFDQVVDIMLGTDKATRRKGEPSIPDIAREMVANPEFKAHMQQKGHIDEMQAERKNRG